MPSYGHDFEVKPSSLAHVTVIISLLTLSLRVCAFSVHVRTGWTVFRSEKTRCLFLLNVEMRRTRSCIAVCADRCLCIRSAICDIAEDGRRLQDVHRSMRSPPTRHIEHGPEHDGVGDNVCCEDHATKAA